MADIGRWLPGLALPLVVALVSACATPSLDETSGARTALPLSDSEREQFLAGMRAYLDSTRVIVEALAANDRERAAEGARKSGMASLSDVSPDLALRLPSPFVMLALETHQSFDGLAASAEANASKTELFDQLGRILATCEECHAMYRVARADGPPPSRSRH